LLFTFVCNGPLAAHLLNNLHKKIAVLLEELGQLTAAQRTERNNIEHQLSQLQRIATDPEKVKTEEIEGNRAAAYLRSITGGNLGIDQAVVAFNHGIVAQSRFDFALAYKAFQSAAALGTPRATHYAALAYVGYCLGKIHEAKTTFEKALELSFDDNDGLSRISCLSNLASISSAVGDNDTSVVYLRQAEIDASKSTSVPQIVRLTISANLGEVLSKTGDHKRACRKLLVVLEELGTVPGTVPDNQLLRAQIYNNLGEICRNEGDVYGSANYHYKALGIRNMRVGIVNPIIAESLNNLALLLREAGDRRRALPLLRAASEINERYLGVDHHYSAIADNNLGILLLELHEHKEALALFDRAQRTLIKSLGNEHEFVRIVSNNLKSLSVKRLPWHRWPHWLR